MSATPKEWQLQKDPDLFNIIDLELDKKIVGEVETRKTILLVMLGGMLTANAAPTSKNLLVNDESGAGKDYICNAVAGVLPKDNLLKRKRISPTVFTYWHNAKFEPEWTWDGKTVILEDCTNSVLNSPVFKVMSSSDGVNVSTVTIQQRAVDVITIGKPVLILTIAGAYPKLETLRRYPICNLDCSVDQTREILKRKAVFHEQGIVPSYDINVLKAIELLKRVCVKVPFASRLVEVLPMNNVIIRTHFDRFIDYIKFSCAIHQHLREADSSLHLLANERDYELARMALLKTTSNVLSLPLTKNQQNILKTFSELPEGAYSVNELALKISFYSDSQLRRELDKLYRFGFLVKDNEQREHSRRPVVVYRYKEHCSVVIPKWNDLQNMKNMNDMNNTNNTNNMKNMKSIGINVINVINSMKKRVTKSSNNTDSTPWSRILSAFDLSKQGQLKSFEELKEFTQLSEEVLQKELEHRKYHGYLHEPKRGWFGLL